MSAPSPQRAIRAYIEHGAHPDPMVRWELDRAARAAALDLTAGIGRSVAVEPESIATDSDPSLPRMLLGGASVLILWAYVGWAGAPYLVKAAAWVKTALSTVAP